MTRSLWVVLFAATSCAHTVEIRSDPPGAAVVEEGEVIGTTPFLLHEQTGAAGFRTIEVQKDGRAQRFALGRQAWAAEPILAGALVGAGMFVGGMVGMVAGSVAYAGGLLAGAGGAPPPVAVATFVGGMVLVFAGSLSMSLAPAAPLLAASWFGRKSPDFVDVDLDERAVTTLPPDMAEPLIGRTDLGGLATTGRRTEPPR